MTITARREVRSATTPPASQDERRPSAGEHEPDLGRRSAQVDHRERERHDDHAVAEHRHALAQEQQAEVAPAQDLEVLAEPHRQRRYTGLEMIQVRSRPLAVRRASAR